MPPRSPEFFYAAGMPILEGYGLTETSPVIAVNTFEHLRLGTVGRPIPGVEVRIAPDGEILTRGPNVMAGYYRKPEATAEAIDRDGWFHTGDIGLLDAGRLPQDHRPEEGPHRHRRRQEHRAAADREPGQEQQVRDATPSCWATGARSPSCWSCPTWRRCRPGPSRQGLRAGTAETLCALPEVQTKLEREVRTTLRDLAQFEMPKKLLLLPRDFSVEAGELTPTLKVKRRVVELRYREEIEELYA